MKAQKVFSSPYRSAWGACRFSVQPTSSCNGFTETLHGTVYVPGSGLSTCLIQTPLTLTTTLWSRFDHYPFSTEGKLRQVEISALSKYSLVQLLSSGTWAAWLQAVVLTTEADCSSAMHPDVSYPFQCASLSSGFPWKREPTESLSVYCACRPFCYHSEKASL